MNAALINSPACTMADLSEAAQYGGTLPCRVCGTRTSYADAVASAELPDIFCSESCRDKREAEYQQYVEVETARAARAFRNRTPAQDADAQAWNSLPDTDARYTRAEPQNGLDCIYCGRPRASRFCNC